MSWPTRRRGRDGGTWLLQQGRNRGLVRATAQSPAWRRDIARGKLGQPCSQRVLTAATAGHGRNQRRIQAEPRYRRDEVTRAAPVVASLALSSRELRSMALGAQLIIAETHVSRLRHVVAPGSFCGAYAGSGSGTNPALRSEWRGVRSGGQRECCGREPSQAFNCANNELAYTS